MIDTLDVAATGFRDALEAVAADYTARAEQEDFDPDAYFDQLRRLIEARAETVAMVAIKGPMGGGGANEA